jgi:hypothetical protein
MSSTRQAVLRGPSLTGFGKRPDFTPAHQVDLETGIGPFGARIDRRRIKPATPCSVAFVLRLPRPGWRSDSSPLRNINGLLAISGPVSGPEPGYARGGFPIRSCDAEHRDRRGPPDTATRSSRKRGCRVPKESMTGKKLSNSERFERPIALLRDRKVFHLGRRQQARRIVNERVLRVDRFNARPPTWEQIVKRWADRGDQVDECSEAPALTEDELFAELGRGYLIALIDLRRLSRWHESHDVRSEATVREAAQSMLLRTIGALACANGKLGTGVNLEPLLRLHGALGHVVNGSNNRLLVTGELADRLSDQPFSNGSRRSIEVRAAALVELLLRHGEKTQLAAARRVARALEKGKFVTRADTVKRWHNQAKRILQRAERISDEDWFGPTHDRDRSFHDLYLAKLFQYDPVMVEEKRRSMFPELTDFDPERELADLEKWCLELRSFD